MRGIGDGWDSTYRPGGIIVAFGTAFLGFAEILDWRAAAANKTGLRAAIGRRRITT